MDKRTYRETYEEGCGKLMSAIPEEREAKLDARLLLEAVCGTDLQTLLAHGEREVSAAEYEEYCAKIERRRGREPLAYILGKWEFMGLPFTVSSDVLIPEQDTENLVEEAMKNLSDGSRILDLCTGSGCILLSLLHYSNGCTGVGTDISPAALSVAEENARTLQLERRTRWLQGDLFDALGPEDGPFDLIISNPPYIPSAVIDTLEPEVRSGEPHIALDGGEDGLSFYRRISAGAADRLSIGGMLMLEIGFDQAGPVTSLLDERGYYDIQVLKDYSGNDRVVSCVKSIRQA